MVLKLFNTLTGKKDKFAPIHKGEARIYHCGPTVYNYAHVGNLRSYIFADVLRRTLEYTGYKVKQVINITDIGQLTSDSDDGEDKMVKALKREGKQMTLEAMKEVADKYEKAFKDDLKALNIETKGTIFPRASEHINEEVEIIKKLEEKGLAYRTSDGIYFDSAKFPEYGTRGGFKLGELKEGARVEINKEKKHLQDFALWKFANGEIGFESPLGKGFPGWHIECSAMSRKYLGQPFDIHTGGIDHIPVHHQNEIAQSEATYGVPLANVWMHNEFVNVASGEKMAKSEENFLTLNSLIEKGIHPLAYRYLLLGAHYRSPISFSWNALETAQNAYSRLLISISKLEESKIQDIDFKEIVSDDLDTPALIAEVWKLLKEKNKGAILNADKILGLDLENQARKLEKEMSEVPKEIKEMVARREIARSSKNFAESDALRAQILSAGYEIMDTEEGALVRKSPR